MCEFCKDDNRGGDLVELRNSRIKFGEASSIGLSLYFGIHENEHGYLLVSLDTDTETIKEFEVDVNYCPMCGGKLGGD